MNGVTEMFEKVREMVVEHKARAALVLLSVLTMGGTAMAVDFSGIVTVVDEIVLIMPFIVDLVIAAIPIIVVIALAAFIVGFLDGIIRKLK